MRRRPWLGACALALAALAGLARSLAACEAPYGEALGSPEAAADGALADDASPEAAAPVDAGIAADAGAVVQISTGIRSACARRSSGEVDCWGGNDKGGLGTSPETDNVCGPSRLRCRTSPVRVEGLAAATHLSLGGLFACAVVQGGEVWCWGDNLKGTLGPGTTAVSSYQPVRVTGLPPALDVAAGRYNACARVTDGGSVRVYCWGSDEFGVNGKPPSAATLSAPVEIAGLAGARSISLGLLADSACAVRADGRVVCWGRRIFGNLGDPDGGAPEACCADGGTCPVSCSTTPGPIGGPTFQASTVSVGYFGSCARTAGAETFCWGSNVYGTLGVGTFDTASHPDPSRVEGISAIAEVSFRHTHACGVGDAGVLSCWGGNVFRELGDGEQVGTFCGSGYRCRPTPIAVAIPSPIGAVSSGVNFTVALTKAGKVYAWGQNNYGALGHPPGKENDVTPCQASPDAAAPALGPGECGPSPVEVRFP